MAANLSILPSSVARANAIAVTAAAVGSKRTAGLTHLQTAIGSGYRFRAFRNSVIVLDATFSGSLPIANSRFELPLSFNAVATLLDSDVSTGTWYGEITKSDGTVKIRGTLTNAAGAGPFKLSGNLVATGTVVPGAIYLAYPATIDGTVYSPIVPAGDEQLVVLSTPLTVTMDSVAVNQHWFPFNSTFPLPALDTWKYSWWHGGWFDSSPVINLGYGNIGVYVGTIATMLQFMIRNPTKQTGRTAADYDFSYYTQWINAHKAIGKQVALHAYVNMSGATATWGQNPWQIPNITPAVFRHALEMALTIGGDTVAFIELANEPPPAMYGASGWPNNWFQEWQGSNALFQAQHALTAQIVRNMGHPAQVIGPTWPNVDCTFALPSFLSAEVSSAGLNAGIGPLSGRVIDNIHAIGIHGYSYQWPGFRSGIDDMLTQRAALGRPDMKIIQSEWMGNVGVWNVDFRESTVDEDYIQFLNRFMYFKASGGDVFCHFKWNQEKKSPTEGFYGNDWSGGASKRTRWENDVRFLLSKPWGRVVLTNSNRMRVTLVDGTSLESGGSI